MILWQIQMQRIGVGKMKILNIRAKDLLKYLDKNKRHLKWYHKMLKRYNSLNIIVKNRKDFVGVLKIYTKHNYLFNTYITKFDVIQITNYSDSKVFKDDFGIVKENWIGKHKGKQTIWDKVIARDRYKWGYTDEYY